MSSSALLRPGVAVGVYPEREDLRENWLDRTAAGLVGMVRQQALGRRPRYGGFVRGVNRAARGLKALSDTELELHIAELRRRLYAEGLESDLVARAFALVREVADRRVEMRHFDVQLFGGWVMLRGMLAEMETGEGKTLTATLPAATAALAGIPVHIVTVNDYLVTRDAAWMGPIYRALGLSVGTITEEMSLEQRRAAYAADITYCTNKQLVFDYLRDRLLLDQESRSLHLKIEGLYRDEPRTDRLLMRGLCFAIVDEADSVLVDEARTPLIISKAGDDSQQERTYKEAIQIGRQMIAPRDFTVHERLRRVDLTELGKAHLNRLSSSRGGVWVGAKTREDLMCQALAALHIYQPDRHYLIQEGRIRIIDEYTGRIMADRSWERGLHQMIEAKEGCDISGRQETLARISYQRFFRRYLRLAGMTGTAREVAGELWSVYRLNMQSIPTNRPTRRRALPDRVYPTAEGKWRAVVDFVGMLHAHNSPVLIGTRSVEASEHLSALLHRAGIPHNVLNAKQDQEEAEIIAEAGQLGQVTVATNMAGRGTDIVLGPLVAKLGGLHVVATERHEARRIDRQLFGRGGRQGDPGGYLALASLEDELVWQFYGDRLIKLLMRGFSPSRPLPGWLGTAVVRVAQRAAEWHHGRMRRRLLNVDDSLADMLAFSGRGE